MFIRGQAQYKDRQVLTIKMVRPIVTSDEKGQFHENKNYLLYMYIKVKSKTHGQEKVNNE
jgi:hypothetical protein